MGTRASGGGEAKAMNGLGQKQGPPLPARSLSRRRDQHCPTHPWEDGWRRNLWAEAWTTTEFQMLLDVGVRHWPGVVGTELVDKLNRADDDEFEALYVMAALR